MSEWHKEETERELARLDRVESRRKRTVLTIVAAVSVLGVLASGLLTDWVSGLEGTAPERYFDLSKGFVVALYVGGGLILGALGVFLLRVGGGAIDHDDPQPLSRSTRDRISIFLAVFLIAIGLVAALIVPRIIDRVIPG